MAQQTQVAKAASVSTLIADNSTQNITPADVRSCFNDLNDNDAANGLVAHAGGGQGSATVLTSMYNSVDTCASDGDSVMLISAKASFKQKVYNNTNNLLSVFPQSGEKINGEVNAEITIFPGNAYFFEGMGNGVWVYTNTMINPTS